jgi:hypothetical protein
MCACVTGRLCVLCVAGSLVSVRAEKEEIFQMNVGNLPPGKECTIYVRMTP